MFRILAPAIIAAIFSQSALAISDSDEFLQSLLLEEFGTRVYAAAGYDKKSALSPEDFEAMGFPKPVSLTEMRNTIKDNELRAEGLFPGPFATFGHIDRVTRILGTPAVRLTLSEKDKDWRYGTVTAFFEEKDVADLASFESGNWLSMVCDSWTYTTDVGLSGCELLPTFSKNFLSQPEKRLKRACSSSPGLVTLLLSVKKGFDKSTPSAYADYAKTLWSNSYFRRTGMVANSTLKAKQSKIFSADSATSEFDTLKKRMKAGEITAEECQAY